MEIIMGYFLIFLKATCMTKTFKKHIIWERKILNNYTLKRNKMTKFWKYRYYLDLEPNLRKKYRF